MPNERRRRSDTSRANVAQDRREQPPELRDEAANRIERPSSISDDVIRHRAYEIYEARGGESGTAFDDWLAAARELRGDNE
jgi:hypothetical protein